MGTPMTMETPHAICAQPSIAVDLQFRAVHGPYDVAWHPMAWKKKNGVFIMELDRDIG